MTRNLLKIKKYLNIKLNSENYLMIVSCREKTQSMPQQTLLFLVKVKSQSVLSVTSTSRRWAIPQSIQMELLQRGKPGSVCKYFNQCLLDADGRFARYIEYLLTAQYAVESKQVADNASIAMRQTGGRLHGGQALTAGAIRNQQVISDMIQKHYAYHFLKSVRGSPTLLSKSHVWCAWNDQAAGNSNVVPHPV